MPTLVISERSLPSAEALQRAAKQIGWSTHFWKDEPKHSPKGEIIYYGGVDVALEVARQFSLALLEPPLDLLSRLPHSLLLREVRFDTLAQARLDRPTFVKPADPLKKCFEAGVYSHLQSIQLGPSAPSNVPILMAEPVEWLMEYRCFVLEGKLTAVSPYLNFNRPIWHPYDPKKPEIDDGQMRAFVARLFAAGVPLPPAFVVDVGMIEGGGWAVVEFNPVWCAGILGADSAKVLPLLRRVCRPRKSPTGDEHRWVIDR